MSRVGLGDETSDPLQDEEEVSTIQTEGNASAGTETPANTIAEPGGGGGWFCGGSALLMGLVLLTGLRIRQHK